MDRRFIFWWRWLLGSAGIVAVFGAALVLAAQPIQSVFESVYYAPNTGMQLGTSEASYTAFLQGVLGATMLGWATLLVLVLLGPFRKAESSAWNMVTASLAVWFIFDTGYSLWSGYWQNAVLNVGVLVLFAIPLAATFRHFRSLRT